MINSRMFEAPALSVGSASIRSGGGGFRALGRWVALGDTWTYFGWEAPELASWLPLRTISSWSWRPDQSIFFFFTTWKPYTKEPTCCFSLRLDSRALVHGDMLRSMHDGIERLTLVGGLDWFFEPVLVGVKGGFLLTSNQRPASPMMGLSFFKDTSQNSRAPFRVPRMPTKKGPLR